MVRPCRLCAYGRLCRNGKPHVLLLLDDMLDDYQAVPLTGADQKAAQESGEKIFVDQWGDIILLFLLGSIYLSGISRQWVQQQGRADLARWHKPCTDFRMCHFGECFPGVSLLCLF